MYLKPLGKLVSSSDQVVSQAGGVYQHKKPRGESQADMSETKVANTKCLDDLMCDLGKQQTPEKYFREHKTGKCPVSCPGIIPVN